MQAVLEPNPFFASTVYTIKAPEFLDSVNGVSNDSLNMVKKDHKANEIYPMVMSGSLSGDARILDFENFIAQSSWTILDNQGYKMETISTYISELWCQEHGKFSNMEQHVHPHGVVISGFYFLECPENGSMVQFHDPRAGKVQAGLPEKSLELVTAASNTISIKPEKGLLVFTNAWLPHSFTRNASDDIAKFIHFNVSITATVGQTAIVV